MARQEMIMPQLGESVAEGTILKWLKAVGDKVLADEMVLEISTDKIDSEIPSPYDGVLVELLFQEGDTVPVRTVIAIVETDASAVVEVTAAPVAVPGESFKGARFYSPLVRRISKENNISLEELEGLDGSGVGGRVNRKDLEAFIASRSGEQPAPAPAAPAPAAPAPAVDRSADRSVVPMDNMRKAIAKHMVESKKTSAHVMSVHEVDLSHLVTWREKWKEHFLNKYGFKLTYTPILTQCVVQAIKEFPWLNASVEGTNIIEHNRINLGMAVATPDGGLLVPVIRNAEELNLLGICRAVFDVGDRARNKKLSLQDLEGGTFTITNAGVFGTVIGFPIINQPQVAILGMNAIVKRPVVVQGDAIAVRSMMFLNLAYDHRIIDGMMAGKFMQRLEELIAEFDVSGEP
jgi:2-oxoglutarate dehydrogenase complex dihydrolipoamide succinyltransferase (E2) component